MNLRALTDDEFDEAKSRAIKVPLKQCPTCYSRETEIPGSGGAKERIHGTYKFHGREHECNCEEQIRLRTHYLAANIGDQYQKLDWDDYTRDAEVKAAVAGYLENWESHRHHGIGLSFASKQVGTGKTLCATYVGKELIKRGQRVFFISFVDMVSAFETNGASLENKMKDITYLILDDVLKPFTERQRDFYALRLESIIRHRTNYDLPTIVTTNLVPEELEEWYPRTFSLLSLKQVDIDMKGGDARGNVAMTTLELATNGEKRPIT